MDFKEYLKEEERVDEIAWAALLPAARALIPAARTAFAAGRTAFGAGAGVRGAFAAGGRAAAPVLRSTATTAAKTAGTEVAKTAGTKAAKAGGKRVVTGAGNLVRRGLRLVSDKPPGAQDSQDSQEPQDPNQSQTVDQQQRQRLAASTEIPRLMRIRLMEKDDDDDEHPFEHPFIQRARDASKQPKRDLTTALGNVRKTNTKLRGRAKSPNWLKALRKHGPKVAKMLARKFGLPGV